MVGRRKVIPHRRALTLRAAKGLCPFGIPESGNPVPRAQGVIGNKVRGVAYGNAALHTLSAQRDAGKAVQPAGLHLPVRHILHAFLSHEEDQPNLRWSEVVPILRTG